MQPGWNRIVDPARRFNELGLMGWKIGPTRVGIVAWDMLVPGLIYPLPYFSGSMSQPDGLENKKIEFEIQSFKLLLFLKKIWFQIQILFFL